MDKNQLLAQADSIVYNARDKFLEFMKKTNGWDDLDNNDSVQGSQIFTENVGN